MKINFKKYLFSGSERTMLVKKNILGSFAIKGLSILSTFVLVPYTINLLDVQKYGVWITIFSFVSWFNLMDIGLGNGFRNKFAEAIAMNEKELAKKYLQTLYSSMTLIAGAVLLLFFAVNPFLSWYQIFNIQSDFDENINVIIAIVFIMFCVQLILKNITTILLAIQKTTLSNSLILAGNIITLILIFLFDTFYTTNLLSVAIIFMASPIIVFIIATIIVFDKYLIEFKPMVFEIPHMKYFNDLMSLGIKFFFIQIATIVMFSSSSMIITQLYGPEMVTPYNVTYQLFAGTYFFFSIIATPFWTAFTEANAKRDYLWIKKSIKDLTIFWGVFTGGVFVLWLISPFIFKIWLGDKIIISYHLSFQFALYAVLISLCSIYSFFLSGVGKVSISLYGSIFQTIVNIPLAIFLAQNLKFNTTGIIMATNLNLILSAIILLIQTRKILNNKAYGIWNR